MNGKLTCAYCSRLIIRECQKRIFLCFGSIQFDPESELLFNEFMVFNFHFVLFLLLFMARYFFLPCESEDWRSISLWEFTVHSPQTIANSLKWNNKIKRKCLYNNWTHRYVYVRLLHAVSLPLSAMSNKNIFFLLIGPFQIVAQVDDLFRKENNAFSVSRFYHDTYAKIVFLFNELPQHNGNISMIETAKRLISSKWK